MKIKNTKLFNRLAYYYHITIGKLITKWKREIILRHNKYTNYGDLYYKDMTQIAVLTLDNKIVSSKLCPYDFLRLLKIYYGHDFNYSLITKDEFLKVKEELEIKWNLVYDEIPETPIVAYISSETQETQETLDRTIGTIGADLNKIIKYQDLNEIIFFKLKSNELYTSYMNTFHFNNIPNKNDFFYWYNTKMLDYQLNKFNNTIEQTK